MASTGFTLYYHPGSYFSQKALYALHEKGVLFKEHIVHIHFGDQHEDWYLRLNPDGKVPLLQDGDKVVAESEEIINYIDKQCPGENPLVPDLGTKLGQEVDRFRKLLNDVEIENITYGVMKNSRLATNPSEYAIRMIDMFAKYNPEKRLADNVSAFKKKIANSTSEEKRKYLEKKVKDVERRHNVTSSIDQVSKLLDEQESLFDELEAQLERMKRSCPSGDYWLCGNVFTAADITATTLALRFYMLGIDSRYFNPNRPLLCEYRERLMARQPAKKIKEALDSVPTITRNKIMQIAATRVLKVGVLIGIIGAGVYVYKKYFR